MFFLIFEIKSNVYALPRRIVQNTTGKTSGLIICRGCHVQTLSSPCNSENNFIYIVLINKHDENLMVALDVFE